MHRFIFIATFLTAVFLVDLFASSVYLPEGPLSAQVEIAAKLTFDNGVSAAKAAEGIPRMTPDNPQPEPALFECTNELYSLVLKYVRAFKAKAGEDVLTDDELRDFGVANCTELFLLDHIIDLNGDGNPEMIVRAGGLMWSSARSDAWTWVVQRTNGEYEVILDAGYVFEIERENKRVGGYSVLSFERHNGGDGFITGSYAYYDGTYRLTDCFLARFNADPVRKERSFCEPLF